MVAEKETGGPSGPLVSITFKHVDTGREVERHWYHVPMVGDSIVLAFGEMGGDALPGLTTGRVMERRWRADGKVLVLVR